MVRRIGLLAASVLIPSIFGFTAERIVVAKSTAAPADLVVHEWGTFLAMQGSDGITLDGMYHEEHALPRFVHSRARDQLRINSIRLKGETPVIYFYTSRPQSVTVSVDFPRGIWTQWYPQARMVAPGLTALGAELNPRSGRITWAARLIPHDEPNKMPALPNAGDDSLWNYARDVDAAYVKVADRSMKPQMEEFERFIFYRGLGNASLPIEFNMADGGTIRSSSHEGVELRHIFVVRVEKGRGAYHYLPAIMPGSTVQRAIPEMTHSWPLDEFTSMISDDLATRLTARSERASRFLTHCEWSAVREPRDEFTANAAMPAKSTERDFPGLFRKEARAMVNTWQNSYFQTEGLRILFVLPQRWTDKFIPMRVTPEPKEIVRVMVGRLEILTPDRESLAESAIRDLASPDESRRARAFDFLHAQGRYVEPIVRRVLANTQDESTRALCERLLLADFVTDLRASLKSAASGSRVAEEPLHIRAKLAALLRSIGFHDEARHEAQQVLEQLQKQTEPHLSNHNARHYFRAKARAFEGLGDDRSAGETYDRFILFASQIRTHKTCIECHVGNDAPTDMNWYRNWWVGRNFALAVQRTHQTHDLIEDLTKRIESGGSDTATAMMLAYLYESAGDSSKARAMWAHLGVIMPPHGSPSEALSARNSEEP